MILVSVKSFRLSIFCILNDSVVFADKTVRYDPVFWWNSVVIPKIPNVLSVGTFDCLVVYMYSRKILTYNVK